MTGPDSQNNAASRAKLTADIIEIERARIFGAALTIAELTNVTAALMVLDAAKARLVRMTSGREGWIG